MKIQFANDRMTDIMLNLYQYISQFSITNIH
jgi:hypothetical protein